MAAWIMLVSGCGIAALGVLAINGRSPQNRQTRLGGWGQLVMGLGLAFMGVPRIVGWSYGVAADVASVCLVCGLLGGGLQITSSVLSKRHHHSNA